jgi:hypothetical protein
MPLSTSHPRLQRQLDRRAALKACGAFAFAGAFGARLTAAADKAATLDSPLPCAATSWKKHGLVLSGTEPWEYNEIQNFNSSVETLPGNRWRIWYCANTPDPKAGPKTIAIAEGEIGGEFKKTPAVLTAGEPVDAPLAIGNLPADWQPVQPVHLHLQNGKHRLYFWVHGRKSGVQRFLAADSEDGRRYRVVNPLTPCLHTIWDRATPTIEPGKPTEWGLAATYPSHRRRPADEPTASVDAITNDGATVYQLPDGSFEMYAQSLVSIPADDPRYMAHDNIPGYIRVIERFVSGDGLKWEQRTRVLQADKKDSIDTQFYYLTVTHTDRGRVGLLGHYYLKDQYTELEWCYSKDGIHWQRPRLGEWVKRGPAGEPDSYAIYPSSAIVERDGRWWLFYTGCNYSHNTVHSNGPPQSVIMLASTPNIWAS